MAGRTSLWRDVLLWIHLNARSEKAMAPHSSTLVWKIPWMDEPARLRSMGLLRVGHDWATSLSLFTCVHWRRKWQPTPVFLPGESQGQRAWWAAVYGVTQSRTRLTRLSSGSNSFINDVLFLQFLFRAHFKIHACCCVCILSVACSIVHYEDSSVHGKYLA